LFSAAGLGEGTHTLRIVYEGRNPSSATTSFVVIDAVEAAGAAS
jgi:hypothetical protein